jgi:hypothetical protein
VCDQSSHSSYHHKPDSLGSLLSHCPQVVVIRMKLSRGGGGASGGGAACTYSLLVMMVQQYGRGPMLSGATRPSPPPPPCAYLGIRTARTGFVEELEVLNVVCLRFALPRAFAWLSPQQDSEGYASR